MPKIEGKLFIYPFLELQLGVRTKLIEREFLIGVEVNNSTITAGLVDLNGKVVKKIVLPTEIKKGKKKVMDNILAAINKTKKEQIIGVGIGIPGIIDKKKGVVVTSIIPGFNNLPLKQMIFDLVHIPIYLDTHANCLVLAEHRNTYARKIKSIVCLDLSETVSGGIILNGKIHHGNNDLAGNFGHMLVSEKGVRCHCNNIGCLETYTSSTAITANYKRLSKKSKSISEIAELAKKDKKAKAIMHDAAKYVSIGLANIMNMINPEVIVLNGKVSKMEGFIDMVKKELEKRIDEHTIRRTSIVVSDLEDAGILGASSIIMNGEVE